MNFVYAPFRVYPELGAMIVALANLDPLAADNQADYYTNRMELDEYGDQARRSPRSRSDGAST